MPNVHNQMKARDIVVEIMMSKFMKIPFIQGQKKQFVQIKNFVVLIYHLPNASIMTSFVTVWMIAVITQMKPNVNRVA
jgi:hypothetical protein